MTRTRFSLRLVPLLVLSACWLLTNYGCRQAHVNVDDTNAAPASSVAGNAKPTATSFGRDVADAESEATEARPWRESSPSVMVPIGDSGGDVTPPRSRRHGSAAKLEPASRPGSTHEGEAAPIWQLHLFRISSASGALRERRLHEEVAKLWRTGKHQPALHLLNESLDDRPGRCELHLLRAAVTLDAYGILLSPLFVADGSQREADVPLPALLFALMEYQAAFPAPAARDVPWTGLYHPSLVPHLIDDSITVWSYGLEALVRRAALVHGKLALYDAFAPDDPSLVDLVVAAQVAGARGDDVAVRSLLQVDLIRYVARDLVSVWTQLLRSLEPVALSLDSMALSDALRLVKAWSESVEASVPGSDASFVALPPAALKALREAPVTPGAGSASSLPVVATPAEVVRDLPMQAGRGTASDDVDAHRHDLIAAFLRASQRLHDFRADVLAALVTGDRGLVLDRDLLAAPGLLFRSGSFGVAFSQRPTPFGSPADVEIPCGDGWRVSIGRGVQ